MINLSDLNGFIGEPLVTRGERELGADLDPFNHRRLHPGTSRVWKNVACALQMGSAGRSDMSTVVETSLGDRTVERSRNSSISDRTRQPNASEGRLAPHGSIQEAVTGGTLSSRRAGSEKRGP